MKILLDPRTLLEYLVHRNNKFEYLSEILKFDSSVQIYLSEPGLAKVVIQIKPSIFKNSEKLIQILKKHKKLEINTSKIIKELPAVWGVPLEQIENLNKILYYSPSYIGVKLLEPKESNSQLNLASSSDKVSTPSTDEFSPQSKNARSIEQIIADSLSNRPAFARSTAQANILKSDGSATACRAYKSYLDVVKQSIHGLNASVARISEIQSSLVDRLSIKPPLTQLIAHPDAARFGNLAASMQVGNSSLINRLLPEPLVARSAGRIDFLKSDISPNVIKSSKNPFDDLIKGALQDSKAHSSLIDRLSIKPILARSIAQANVAKISSLMPENLGCKSLK